MISSQNAVRLAGRWLKQSGIQHKNGGVAAWYEADTGLYPFLYSEITGYAISTYLFLNTVRRDPQAIRAAHRAASWLIRSAAAPKGGVKTRLYLVKNYESPNYSFHRGRVYAFDTAMAGYGLTQLAAHSGNKEYLEAAGALLRFLMKRMVRPDGTFWAYLDPRTGRCGEEPDKWSDQSGSFHAKLALFLLDYARTAGDPEVRRSALQLLNRAASAQETNGRFVTATADKSTHLHPHAYTLEGLIYGAWHLRNDRFLHAALKGFEWMLRAVSDDGSVACLFVRNRFTHHERSDIVAQLLRVGSMLYAIYPARMRRHLDILERVKRHLMLFQYRGDGQAGGFIYGSATDGLLRFHFNAWASMFALQALWMHDAFVLRREPLRTDPFI